MGHITNRQSLCLVHANARGLSSTPFIGIELAERLLHPGLERLSLKRRA